MATVAEALLQRLNEWDVDRIYGYPGDGINGIHDAQESMGEEAPPFIQARHEEEAAFMASAHGKWTGEPGVALATSGPGAIHLLNGLYDAKLDRSPVVAIVGQQAATSRGGSYQQEVDLHTLYKDVASDYLVEVTTPEQIPMVVDRAFRTAMGRRCVTGLIIPADVQEAEYVDPPHEFKMVPGSLGFEQPHIVPPDDQLDEAADILNEGERVAILVGQGAAGAVEEVKQVAERLDAGVAKALLGKDVLPDDLPYVTGPIGLLGSKPTWDMMMNCDTLLMVGSNVPYSQFLPEWGQARGIQIDISPHNIGLRYPFETNLVGDAADTLAALLPRLDDGADGSWREKIELAVDEWWEVLEARAGREGDPVNPQFAFWKLSERLPDDVIISADSGSGTNWFARDLQVGEDMRASLSGTLASMGPAVPYALAAKFCHPERVAVACVGDGAMQMIGNNALITAAKYWRQWEDPRMIVFVLNNGDLNQVTWEMRAMGGFPMVTETQQLPDFPFAEYAELLDLKGIRVEDRDDVADAWDEAFAADRPVVYELMADPDIPPIPPHVKSQQVRSMTKAILSGDERTRDVIRQGIKEEAAGIFEGLASQRDDT